MHGKHHGSDHYCIPEKLSVPELKQAWCYTCLYLLSLICMPAAANLCLFICDILARIDGAWYFDSKHFSPRRNIYNDFMELLDHPLAWIQGSTPVYAEVFCQLCVWVQGDLESTCLKLNTCCHVFLSKHGSLTWNLSKYSNMYYNLKQLK